MKKQVDLEAKIDELQESVQRKDADFEKDRKMVFLFEELSGELNSKNQKCIHTPDLLEHIGTDRDDDSIIEHFKCQCGKEIKEVFAHSKKRQLR